MLANNNPERFAYIYRNFDEFYMIFDFVVQFSHLKAYDASFAEKFYSLRRVPCNLAEKNDSQNLPPQQLYSSLFLLVGFPYVRNKLDIVWERLKFAELEGRINKTRNPTQYWFLKIYPVINGVYEFWSLCDHLTYAVGNGRYHSPLLRLAAVQLCNFVLRDAGETSDMSSVNSWTNYFKYLSLMTTKFIAKSVGTGLSVGAFFLQFLDYWFTRENAPPSFAPLPIPPPPETVINDFIDLIVKICFIDKNNAKLAHSNAFHFSLVLFYSLFCRI